MRRLQALWLGAVALSAAGGARAEEAALAVSGMVATPLSLSVAALHALPAHTVDADFTTMHGEDHHTWTGVLLWDLVQKAGLRDEPGRRTTMRHVFLARGKDGYEAAIAIGEIDPAIGNREVLVAYRQDADLPTLRLIVPGDRHGARDVHDLVAIEVR